MKNFVLAMLLCLFFCSCSGGNNPDPDKGSIEKLTEQAGKEAAEAIKKPIDKARNIDDLAQKRLRNLDQPADQEVK